MVKEKFFTIYQNAVASAEVDFKELLAKTKGKSDGHTIQSLHKRLKIINQKIKESNYVAYTEDGINKIDLCNLFLSRTILLNVDDINEIYDQCTIQS